MEKRHPHNPSFWLLIVILVSLALNIRFMVSLGMIFLLVTVLLQKGKSWKFPLYEPAFLFLSALFLWQLAGIFYTDNLEQGWKELTKKSAILVIPFFFFSIRPFKEKRQYILVLVFSVALTLGITYCLAIALVNYLNGGNISIFYYHQLVKPLGHHAVVYSFILFFCLTWWLPSLLKRGQKRIAAGFSIAFFLFILLLASKLVILLSLFYLALFFSRQLIKQKRFGAFAACLAIPVILVLFTANPVRDRFADLGSGPPDLFLSSGYHTGQYFNGMQFRLLNWRFTSEILDEENAWITGLGTGDAQQALDEKYAASGMYTGNNKNDRGFLGYNAHNLYLQTLLESGLAGLFWLLLYIGRLYLLLRRDQQYRALIFFIAILIFGLTESLFSTQYALLLFVFFPLLARYQPEEPAHPKVSENAVPLPSTD